VTPEGVVLGADSTLSVLVSSSGQTGYHYYNHNQKLLEIGQESSLGIVTWGLGSLEGLSYRTLVALLADQLSTNLAHTTPLQAAQAWISLFFPKYTATIGNVNEWTVLAGKAPYDPNAAQPHPTARTKDEEKRFQELKGALSVGFCIAGSAQPQRAPMAYAVIFQPTDTAPPTASPLAPGQFSFWGAPNMIERLIWGRDSQLRVDIKASGKWGGTDPELDVLLNKHFLAHGPLPIRDAIDFVHACIYSTIKGIKFSNLPQTCGGPIELAVITTDRNFRWVKHKSFDEAVEGE
jgi:hypothetical protein